MSWLKKVFAEIAQDQENAMNAAAPTDDIIDVDPTEEDQESFDGPDHPLETLKKLLKGIHPDNISFSYKQTEDGKRIITIELPSKSKEHLISEEDKTEAPVEAKKPEGPQMTGLPVVAKNKTNVVISQKQKTKAFLDSYVFKNGC